MAIKVSVSIASILRKLTAETRAYIQRVTSDGGTVISSSDTNRVIRWLKTNNLLDSTELLYLSTAGLSIRDAAGNLQFVEKVYSLDHNLTPNDGTQAVELNQPRLVGGIAPGAKVALSNQNGEARFLTHPEISFDAGDAWSVSYLINNNGSQLATNNLIQTSSPVYTEISIKIGGSNRILLFTSSPNTSILFNLFDTKNIIGKLTHISITHNGSGSYALYINGEHKQSINSIAKSYQFDSVYSKNSLNALSCILKTYKVSSINLTPAQVLAEYNLLSSLYPEVESTTIGSQIWSTRNFEAVATPEGNVIANVTENGAVEKYASDFSVNVDGFITIRTTVDGNIDGIEGVDDVLRAYASADVSTSHYIYRASSIFAIGYQKIELNYYIPNTNTNVNGFRIGSGIGAFTPFSDVINTVGSWQSITLIIKSSVVSPLQFRMNKDGIESFTGAGVVTDDLIYFKNIKITELNWSNATEIYDAVYAATSGTAEEKEYAALKEAAMWCYYNNSADNGAIYGKLYNWYAAKLLDLDMLSAGFGWRITQDADWSDLDPNSSDAALKYTGENFWETGNIATNEDGLTVLGGGFRNESGYFFGLKEDARVWNSDDDSTDPRIGASVRLIKTT